MNNEVKKSRSRKKKKRSKREKRDLPTHHKRINEKIIVLEGIENRRSVDTIFVVFAKLESSNNSG